MSLNQWPEKCAPFRLSFGFEAGTLAEVTSKRVAGWIAPRLPWLLLVSLVPMLTFMGHWPSTLPIPGTDSFISVPLAGSGSHDEHSPGSGAEHARHCHGGVASCGDAPAGAGVSLALVETPGTLAVAALGLIALALASWRPRRSFTVGPELRPPRAGFASA